MTNADGDHEIDIEDLLNRLADSVEERKQQRADLASGLEFLARTVSSEARAHWSSARGSPLANDLAAPEVGERASPAALVRAEVSLLMASGLTIYVHSRAQSPPPTPTSGASPSPAARSRQPSAPTRYSPAAQPKNESSARCLSGTRVWPPKQSSPTCSTIRRAT